MPRTLSDEEVAAFRERLCEAATGLFAEKGVAGVTMREIAAKLGVSAMTPYRYFHDKDDILAAVRARAFDRFAATLEEAYDGPGTIPERSMRKRHAYIRFALEQRDCYRLMFDLSQPGEETYPDLHRAMTRARATMSSHVRDLVAAGLLFGDPELIGYVFWASMHGVISLELAGKFGPEYDYQTVLDASFSTLISGFRSKG